MEVEERILWKERVTVVRVSKRERVADSGDHIL